MKLEGDATSIPAERKERNKSGSGACVGRPPRLTLEFSFFFFVLQNNVEKATSDCFCSGKLKSNHYTKLLWGFPSYSMQHFTKLHVKRNRQTKATRSTKSRENASH